MTRPGMKRLVMPGLLASAVLASVAACTPGSTAAASPAASAGAARTPAARTPGTSGTGTGGTSGTGTGGTGQAAARTSGTALKAGQTGTRSQVPWRSVGDGWALAVVSSGRLGTRPDAYDYGRHADVLELIDPAGGRYQLYRWPVSGRVRHLISWSGDRTRALISVYLGNVSHVTMQILQVNLVTGVSSAISLAGAYPAGYTPPSGRQILGLGVLARYDLAGQRVATLYQHAEAAIYNPDGTMIAVYNGTGIVLVSNTGGVVRKLPVPHGRDQACLPAGWWDSATLQVRCTGLTRPLWLVPVSGAAPTPLVTNPSGSLAKDVQFAVPAAGRVFLEGPRNCRAYPLFQLSGGSAVPVVVPGTNGSRVDIVGSDGSRLLLLIGRPAGCFHAAGLLWFTPATGAVQWVRHRSPGEIGVQSALMIQRADVRTNRLG